MADRVQQLAFEFVGPGSPHVRETQIVTEFVGPGSPHVRMPNIAIEIVYPYAAAPVKPIQEFILR